MPSHSFPSQEEHIKYLEKFNINQKRAMIIIILSILIDVFGYTLVLPLLPSIAKTFGASDIIVGILISSNAFSALIFAPIWGKLSDKYGRKSILIISQIGTGVSFLILGLSNSIYIILFARVLDGVFGGQIPVIRAYITDITTPQTRAQYMGKIMVGYTLGMILGPTIGGLLGVINWRFPPYLASSLSIVSIVTTIKLIVETMPAERRADIKSRILLNQANLNRKESIWNKEIGFRFTQIFLVSLASIIFTSSLALVLDKRYGANPFIIGSIMAVAGINVLIFGVFLMRRIIRKFGEKRLLFTSFIIFIIVFTFYPFLFELWMVYIFIIPYSFCLVFMNPLIQTNITKAVGPDKQGEVSGWTTNLQAVSQSIAPLISTGFLEIGTLAISFIYLNSYQLIGFTNVLLATILLIIGYLDIKYHPKLYLHERLRRKRKAMRKKKNNDKKFE